MAEFVGLDVSLEETAVCVVDEAGEVLWEGKAASEPEAIVAWLTARKVCAERVGLEAGPLSPWLTRRLQELGLAAICIETRRMKGVAATMTGKSDRKDARTIAQAMRTGWYTAVHVKSEESQRTRLLLNCRRQAAKLRVELENSLRGSLKAFGVKLGAGTGSFEARLRRALAERPELLALVEPLLALRAQAAAAQAKLDKRALAVARASAPCRLCMTVPGVGAIVALTYVSALDDPARFARSRDVGPHLGLVPRRHQSGEVDRNGRIGKCGDEAAREALFMAAHTLLTTVAGWSKLKAWGIAVAKRRGLRRATVATARKLAVILHRMWRDGAPFQHGAAA